MARNGIFAAAVLPFPFTWNGDIFALVLTRTAALTCTARVTGYFGAQSTAASPLAGPRARHGQASGT